MNVVANTDRADREINQPATAPQKRRPGRPKGSKNKPKYGFVPVERQANLEEGWGYAPPTPKAHKTFKAKSLAAHRKWQRETWALPQFVMSRKNAQELLVKYLRSKPGRNALITLVTDGFTGIGKMPDGKLGEFLVSTNLLSRYPHEIVIRAN